MCGNGHAGREGFKEQKNMKQKRKKERKEPITPLAPWREGESEGREPRGMNPISVLRHTKADRVLNELTTL